MSELSEPLLPEENLSRNSNPVNWGRYLTGLLLTLTVFISSLIILASQLPPQQNLGMTTLNSQASETVGQFQ